MSSGKLKDIKIYQRLNSADCFKKFINNITTIRLLYYITLADFYTIPSFCRNIYIGKTFDEDEWRRLPIYSTNAFSIDRLTKGNCVSANEFKIAEIQKFVNYISENPKLEKLEIYLIIDYSNWFGIEETVLNLGPEVFEKIPLDVFGLIEFHAYSYSEKFDDMISNVYEKPNLKINYEKKTLEKTFQIHDDLAFKFISHLLYQPPQQRNHDTSNFRGRSVRGRIA